MKRYPFLFSFMLCSFFSISQINFTANDVVPPYDGDFRYGSNLGNYPPWTNPQLGDIAAGNLAVGQEGIGVQAFRPALPEHFFESWGYDIRVPDFQAWEDVGISENVAFIGFPSEAHRDPEFYCDTLQSALFANMFLPIWDNGENGTPVNDDNYYALYLYKMVNEYKDHVRFWEIWNEPDFTYSSTPWLLPGQPGNWWENDPDPCDYLLFAPVYHYVRLLRISFEVIKTVDESAYVCIGGIGNPAFLDAVLRNTDNPADGSVSNDYPLLGGAYFDVLSFHSYPHIDGSMWEFPPAGGIVFNRHSDRGVEGMLEKQTSLRNVLENYGYGNTYPQKLWVLSETMVPRVEFQNYIGSEEAQRNYLIKSLVEAQRNDIVQVDVFSLSELSDFDDAWNEYLLMGLFENLSSSNLYEQILTGAGKAFHTTTNLLSGNPHDVARTAELDLPNGIKGAAFADTDTSHIYVLWAVTDTDQSEAANATYSFPASFEYDSLYRWDWEFSQTFDSLLIPAQEIPLTATPIFVKEYIPPPEEPEDTMVIDNVLDLQHLNFELDYFPNPFSEVLNIQLSVKESGIFSIALFDLQGRLVENVLNGKYLNTQKHFFEIRSQQISNGIYFLKFQTEYGLNVQKVILNR